jgi:Ca2+-binding RTX toxin-like protein
MACSIGSESIDVCPAIRIGFSALMARPGRRVLGGIGAALAALALSLPAAAGAAPGDVYVADRGSSDVWKLGPNGGDAVSLTHFTAPTSPYGLTLGPDGFLYVADEQGKVWKVDRNTGDKTIVTEPGPTTNPIDVDFDAQGRLFMTDYDNDAIVIVDRSTGARTTLFEDPTSNGFNTLAILRDGTMFASDENDSALYRFSAAGARTTVAENDTALDSSDGLLLTPDERYLYVGSFSRQDYVRYDLQTGTRTIIPLDGAPYNSALLPDGRLLYSDGDDAHLEIVPQSGGPATTFSSDPDLGTPRGIVVEPAPCAGLIPTVVGTNADEVINGSPFNDVIETLGGNDTVRGLGGNDIVCGGLGKDKLNGGPGNDRLFGEQGKDNLIGKAGKDGLFGGPGKDKLVGGKGKDKLRGGAGKDKQKQ